MRAWWKYALAGIILSGVVGGISYYLWGKLQRENQLSALRGFCANLKNLTSVNEIQMSVALTLNRRMLLLSPGPDGNQNGLIYVEGVSGAGCVLSFMQGRLTQKSFSYGLATDPTKPAEKPKAW